MGQWKTTSVKSVKKTTWHWNSNERSWWTGQENDNNVKHTHPSSEKSHATISWGPARNQTGGVIYNKNNNEFIFWHSMQ